MISKSAAVNLASLHVDSGASILIGSLAGGLGVMAGIVITGAASGGQINPAVSVGMAACGRLPLKKLPAYLLGQYLGALLGALLVGVLLYCGNGESTMAMASYPVLATRMLPQVVDQLICTCLLVLGITAVVDHYNDAF